MSDRDAIADLVYRYADRLDAGDLEGVARLFADATFGPPGGPVRRGTDAVLARLREIVVLYDGVPRTKHVTTNVVVEVDSAGGTAVARSYFTVLQATPTLPLQPIVAGRYLDRFARRTDGWQFTERQVVVDLTGDMSQHVRRR